MSTTPEQQAGIMTAADAPILGEQPTADELEQVTWAEEAIRTAPVLLRDSLRQLITLDTALLAGSAAFLDKMPMPWGLKAMAAVCLLLSLFGALWGSLPREAQVCPYAPNAIKHVRESNLTARLWWLKWASAFLFFGLGLFVVGLFL
ncbi:MAG TPA: hypothetical protein VH682_24680 [Gemmataceae bacterium]|jgi:hypothetical protein